MRNDSNNQNVEGATRNRLETLISLRGSNYGVSENRKISARLSASSRQEASNYAHSQFTKLAKSNGFAGELRIE